jgi:hypothetical protein
MSTKGDWSRVRDNRAFRENYDKIFRLSHKHNRAKVKPVTLPAPNDLREARQAKA